MTDHSAMFEPVLGVEPTKGGYYLWRYVPNKGAAVFFLLLFLGSFFYTSWKIWRTRTWFCIVFAIGCLCEMAGYAARASAASQTGRIMPFAVQNTYILVAPALFAASIYMTLGRIITCVEAEKYSPIRPRRLTKTFVTGDILSFLIQGGAAGMMMINKPGFAEWGERIVIFGLLIQVILFGLFVVVATVFHRRLLLVRTPASVDLNLPWEQSLYMLYIVSGLIMVRSVFRVVEFIGGQTGYLLSHEWTLYIFDTLLMFAVTVIFLWRFPSDMRVRGGIPL